MNTEDQKEMMVLNQKLGLGPEYINYDKGIRYTTSAKQAIKVASQIESVAEEMRVLYVALTRAKEKLIISGTAKDYLKEAEKKKELLEIYNAETKGISPILLKKHTSYLDWIDFVIFSKDMQDVITKFIHTKEELLEEKKKETVELPRFDFNKDIDIEKIKDKLNFEYKYDFVTRLQSKSTVSKIKSMLAGDIVDSKVGLASLEPKFMLDTKKVSSSEKGTLMHLMLQKINFRETYTLEKLEALKEELVAKKFISSLQAKSIESQKLLNFINSDFAQDIKNAKLIEKEKAFCTKIMANDVYEEAGDTDEILVQGIIDLYFINENDELILVDYKTDYIEEGEENLLIKKYKKQLEIYKKALEEALHRKVEQTYIYSLKLNKEIPF